MSYADVARMTSSRNDSRSVTGTNAPAVSNRPSRSSREPRLAGHRPTAVPAAASTTRSHPMTRRHDLGSAPKTQTRGSQVSPRIDVLVLVILFNNFAL
jgi:hypothetical protein